MNSNYLKRVGMSSDLKQVCYRQRLRYGALARIILLKLSVRVELSNLSSVESNETTAATVSCDLAPPPQRRRRRHLPPPPPRRPNLPFVTFQGSKETYLSLHNLVNGVKLYEWVYSRYRRHTGFSGTR